jgi:hypothetical protein
LLSGVSARVVAVTSKKRPLPDSHAFLVRAPSISRP